MTSLEAASQAEEGKVGGIDDLRPLVHILAALSEMLSSSMSGRAARRSAMRRPVVPEEPSIKTFTLMRFPPPMRRAGACQLDLLLDAGLAGTAVAGAALAALDEVDGVVDVVFEQSAVALESSRVSLRGSYPC